MTKKKLLRKTTSKPVSPGLTQHTPWWQSDWFFALALVAVTFLAYQPAWNGAPLWDDDNHLTPPRLQSLTGLVKMWTQPGTTVQYYPLIYSIFWVEHIFWGDATLGYHLLNILLHLVSALLLLRILRRLEIPGAQFAVILFALHPVQVESVAWITEIKNTLSGAFFFAAGLSYLHFRLEARRRWMFYAIALVLFVLGLFSKTVISVLPPVLLVVFWWKWGKLSLKKDVAPLIPFFAIGVSFGLFTAWMEKKFVGAVGAEFMFSPIDRILIAGRAIWFYLWKLVWPYPLMFIYPHWEISSAVWWQYLFPAAVIGLAVVLWLRRKQSRGPLAALLLFGGMLFPALGFVDIYPFRYSFVADHFQYLACVAPMTLAAAAAAMAFERLEESKRRAAPLVCSLALIVGLSALTFSQSAMYTDIETLWKTTIAKNPACWMAYQNLGLMLLLRGEPDNAIPNLETSLRIKNDSAEGHTSLGLALEQKGRPDEALTHFRKAVQLKPDYAAAYNDLGSLLHDKGDLDEAIVQFRKAVELKHNYTDAEYNLGVVLLKKGQLDEAITRLQSTLDAQPGDADAHVKLGLALQWKGNTAAAVEQYQRAIVLKPDHAEAHSSLGRVWLQQGRTNDALPEFQKAVALEPNDVATLNDLAWLLATNENYRDGEKAIAAAERATQLTRGTNPDVLHTLAAAYAAGARFDNALVAARRALQLAEAAHNTSLAEMLRKEIALYQAHTALH